MIPALVDHLWQSTLFTGGAGALNLLLRRSGAGIRYGIWLTASAKFLIPFAALAAMGTTVSHHLNLVLPSPPVLTTMAPVVEPTYALREVASFSANSLSATPGRAAPFNPAPVLLSIWAVGFSVVAVVWTVRWRRVRQALKAALPMQWPAPVQVLSTALLPEPGVVGWRRPVLLLPIGIAERLSSDELDAVIAHELCHVRRRDNLTAVAHMVVQALFWFYPLTWWLGARLVEERERACDEAVIRAGHERETYARGILQTCRHGLQSPLICVAGVSGANLKKRVEVIMTAPLASPSSHAAKTMFGAAVVAVLSAPVATGVLSAGKALQSQTTLIRARSTPKAPLSESLAVDPPAAASNSTPASPAAQVAAPSKDALRPPAKVRFDPSRFDRYLGYYQLAPHAVLQITRIGARFYARLTGQGPIQIFPQSDTEFDATAVPVRISFNLNAEGRPSGLVLHQNGREASAFRMDQEEARSSAENLRQRIASNTPSPGTAGFLKRFVEAEEAGAPDLSEVTPDLAAAIRTHDDALKGLGAVQSIQFAGVTPQGFDRYTVAFAKAVFSAVVGPLDSEGKVGSLLLSQPVPSPSPVAVRVKANLPRPGSEASIRQWLQSMQAGRPDYDDLTPRLAEIGRKQWPAVRQQFKAFGRLHDIHFVRVSPDDRDVYEVDFQNYRIEVAIGALTPEGKVDQLGVQVLP